jgi:hypothetical protein
MLPHEARTQRGNTDTPVSCHASTACYSDKDRLSQALTACVLKFPVSRIYNTAELVRTRSCKRKVTRKAIGTNSTVTPLRKWTFDDCFTMLMIWQMLMLRNVDMGLASIAFTDTPSTPNITKHRMRYEPDHEQCVHKHFGDPGTTLTSLGDNSEKSRFVLTERLKSSSSQFMQSYFCISLCREFF